MDFFVSTDLAKIEPRQIDSNIADVRKWLESSLSTYSGMVVSEDAIREAKDTLASIRKVKKALSDQRISTKKQFLEPFTVWENEVKELEGLCDKTAEGIDKQLKVFEDQRKEAKKAKLKSCLEGWSAGVGIEDYLPYDEVADPRWLNSTFPMEEATKAIRELIQTTAEDLRTIRELHSEFETALLNNYKQSRDLRKVLAEEQTLRAMKEREAARREFIPPAPVDIPEPQEYQGKIEEKSKTEQTAAPAKPIAKTPKTWELKFKVTVTKEQMFALKDFFVNNKIKYEQLEERKEKK